MAPPHADWKPAMRLPCSEGKLRTILASHAGTDGYRCRSFEIDQYWALHTVQ